MSARFERGQFFLNTHRLKEAEGEFRAGLAESPQSGWGHSLLAMTLAAAKKFDEAVAEAGEGIALEPDSWHAHYAMAAVLHDMGDLKKARGSAEEAVALNPEAPATRGLLSAIFFRMSKWSDALREAEAGLEFDAEDVRCGNLRAMALVKLGRADEAGRTLDATLARDPEDAHSHANMGWTLLNQGRPREAMESFREALRLSPGMEWARVGIITAIKARNPVYRMFLNYVLFMERLPPRVRTFAVLGLYVGYQVLHSVAKSTPALAPFALPLLIVYFIFVLTSWLADPFFNLLLRLHPLGRHALNARERWGGTLLGVCLVLGGAAGAVALARHSNDLLFDAALIAATALPATAACGLAAAHEKATVYRVLTICCASVAMACGLFAFGLDVAGSRLSAIFLLIGVVCVAGSTWLHLPKVLRGRA